MTRRYLRGNARCEQPSSLIFLAIESTIEHDFTQHLQEYHQLERAVASYCRFDGKYQTRREQLDSRSVLETWDWIFSKLQKRKPTWLFCHNANYVMTQLLIWDAIREKRLRIHRVNADGKCYCNNKESKKRCWRGQLVIDNRPWFCCFDTDYGRVNVVDVQNYWNVSLDELAESVGIDMGDNRDREVDGVDAVNKLTRQCEAINVAVCSLLQFWKEQDLGNFKMTIAGLSFGSFRHRGLDKTIVLDDNPTAREVESQAYHGGQISCYYYGMVSDPHEDGPVNEMWESGYEGPIMRQPVYELDVQSMYPSVLSSHLFPTALSDVRHNPSVKDAVKIASGRLSVAAVTVSCLSDGYPLRTPNNTVFPEGRYGTVICGHELERAIQTDAIVDCEWICSYDSKWLFAEWVHEWWGRRKEYMDRGMAVEADFCKLIMNSLYGKFGQRTPFWVAADNVRPMVRWGQWVGPCPGITGYHRFRSIAGVVQRQAARIFASTSFPAISAFVTSYGREKMLEYRLCCPRGSVLYQHTDALVVTEAGYNALVRAGHVQDGIMGCLRLKSRITQGLFRGPNNVTLNGVDRVAGVGKYATKLSSHKWTRMLIEPLSQQLSRVPDGRIGVRTVEIELPGRKIMLDVGRDGWATQRVVGF